MATASPSAVRRHPHLAEAPREGWVRVDMHAHTMWSGDSTTTPDEFEQALIESGVDVVCVTDHNALEGAVRMAERIPGRVVVGEEVRTHHGEVIGLFLEERIPSGLRPEQAAEQIREQGGLVYVPHPFDPLRANLREQALEELTAAGLVDAVEVRNAKTSLEHLNERAVAFAAQQGVGAGAGSDAHVPDALGAACVEMPDFDDPASFLAALAEGVVVGHHFDPPRPWRPRVIPSITST